MPIQTVLTKKGDQLLNVPVKIWAAVDTVESAALDQLKNIASLPFVFKHVAVMPDVHLGKGATVGSVVATKGAVCPAAVGVDIGCGMMAIKTELNPAVCQDKIEQIRHSIERSVPVGPEGNNKLSRSVEDWKGWAEWETLYGAKGDVKLWKRAKGQLGSLGGGNHFIELCLDQDRNVWVMLHSGSRNIGKELAERHIDVAGELMKRMLINLPDKDLAYLPQSTPEFDAYVHDLNWAQDYAKQNRIEMAEKIMKDLSYAVNKGEPIKRVFEVNCHHNYLAMEHHYGENVLVTRKGAVRARTGDFGIIPGSMGTRSYIVKGKGVAESFCSCSHGAGRRMSRNEAKRKFNLEDLIKQTEGVECRKDAGVLDEIPGAYKSIDEVMENQSDLVEVVATLKQFMCIKG